jgi:DNA-binding transcriptional ArsR family regulator
MPQLSASLDRAFQALADPTRRAVIERLSRGPASVSELARPFDMALPSFMQHLGMLEARGLIRTRKQGRVRTCEIVAEPLEEMSRWLGEQRALWTTRIDQLDSYLLTLKIGETPE